MDAAIIPIIVFLGVYVALTFELVNKAVAALLGVMVLVVLRVVTEHQAVEFIDFETIMLLLGIMSIVAILRKSGFFQIVSVRIAELTKGSPLKILILFSIVTAGLSAFLDNVTTVLIIIPIIIELTAGMGLDPKMFVISQAIISNIGGTATLIGDPPNIIIGSKVGLNFNQFVLNLALPVIICCGGALVFFWATNREKFKPINTNLSKLFSVQLLLEKIRYNFLGTRIDKVFLTKSLVCLGVAILLFVTQTVTRISPGVVAVMMAMVLFVVTRIDVEEMLEEIEWSTLLFFTINAFIESIRQVRCSVDELSALHAELAEVIKNAEPKVIPLIHLLEEFENEIGAAEKAGLEEVKAMAIRILQSKYDKIRCKIGRVVEHGLTCIKNGDVIVVHTLSYDVTNMLKLAREVLHKDFRMIVLKQDLTKTRRLIKSLTEADIDMDIIPEYALSHYVEQGDKLFMGALSITEDGKVISAAGSANIVSLCHLNHLPVYVFANSLKFSHNVSSKQRIHRKVEAKSHGDVSFQLITHSHDSVDLKHVDYLVTEDGIKDKSAIADFSK